MQVKAKDGYNFKFVTSTFQRKREEKNRKYPTCKRDFVSIFDSMKAAKSAETGSKSDDESNKNRKFTANTVSRFVEEKLYYILCICVQNIALSTN